MRRAIHELDGGDHVTGEVRVMIVPAKNLDAVSDERIAAIKKLRKRGQEALRPAEALEQKGAAD